MARPRSDKLTLKHIGPIADVELELGDLTLLVGPQGTGKSIALQLFKLSQDRFAIAKLARENNLVWNDLQQFLDAYLGVGLGAAWSKKSVFQWKGKDLSLPPRNQSDPAPAQVFYVPAQRALTVADGWPRAFSDYASAPFVVREFGLRLQQMLLRAPTERIFPAPAGSRRACARRSTKPCFIRPRSNFVLARNSGASSSGTAPRSSPTWRGAPASASSRRYCSRSTSSCPAQPSLRWSTSTG